MVCGPVGAKRVDPPNSFDVVATNTFPKLTFYLLLFALIMSGSANPMDCSLPGSSVHRFLKNTGLDCHALLRGSSQPEIEPTSFMSPALADRFFIISTTQEAHLLNNYCPKDRTP